MLLAVSSIASPCRTHPSRRDRRAEEVLSSSVPLPPSTEIGAPPGAMAIWSPEFPARSPSTRCSAASRPMLSASPPTSRTVGAMSTTWISSKAAVPLTLTGSSPGPRSRVTSVNPRPLISLRTALSSPPSVSTVSFSTPSVRVEPPAAAIRARFVCVDSVNASAPAVPTARWVSTPVPPWTWSLPWPTFQTAVSMPAPRSTTSLPRRPVMVSLPIEPRRVSAPLPPRRVSLPPPPSITVARVVVKARRVSSMRMVSLPPAPLTWMERTAAAGKVRLPTPIVEPLTARTTIVSPALVPVMVRRPVPLSDAVVAAPAGDALSSAAASPTPIPSPVTRAARSRPPAMTRPSRWLPSQHARAWS